MRKEHELLKLRRARPTKPIKRSKRSDTKRDKSPVLIVLDSDGEPEDNKSERWQCLNRAPSPSADDDLWLEDLLGNDCMESRQEVPKPIRYKRERGKGKLDKHVCQYCGECFRYSSLMTRHIQQHTGEKRIVCEICGRLFNHMNSFKTHMSLHTGRKRPTTRKYTCKICARQFTHADNCRKHMRNHDNAQKRPITTNQLRDVHACEFVCHVCDARFNSPANLRAHLLVCGRQRVIYECACLRKFTGVAMLRRHMREHETHLSYRKLLHKPAGVVAVVKVEKTDDTDVAGDGIKRDLDEDIHVKSDVDVMDEKQFACVDCERVFTTAWTLKRHVRAHASDKYDCDACNRRFTDRYAFKKHLLVHDNGKYRDFFKCEYCEKKFTGASYLKRHVQVHDKARAKPYACDACTKTFMYERNLFIHQLKHVDRRLFECERCHERFHSPFFLKTHYVERHNVDAHACMVCEKVFIDSSRLKRHMLTHTGEKPLICDQCGKRFARNSDIARHILTHSGEKPHRCGQCGKAFTQSGNLRAHELIHMGVKPFKCERCSREFGQKSNLNKHVQWVHGSKTSK